MFKRTPLKRKPFKAKRTPLKRVSEKRMQEIVAYVGQSYRMENMFASVWNKRPHRCEVCDAYLGNEEKSYMFDHLLEKSKYPDLQYEELNILLVCLSCHECKTNGHPKPKHKEAIEKVKEIFSIT